MTVEETILEALGADAGVTALVPKDRIKPPGDWQELELPYIVHFPISLLTTPLHDGLAKIRQWPFYQVSCFASSYSQAKAVAEAVRKVLGYGNFSGVQTFWRNQRVLPFEGDIRVQQIAQDFEVFEAL